MDASNTWLTLEETKVVLKKMLSPLLKNAKYVELQKLLEFIQSRAFTVNEDEATERPPSFPWRLDDTDVGIPLTKTTERAIHEGIRLRNDCAHSPLNEMSLEDKPNRFSWLQAIVTWVQSLTLVDEKLLEKFAQLGNENLTIVWESELHDLRQKAEEARPLGKLSGKIDCHSSKLNETKQQQQQDARQPKNHTAWIHYTLLINYCHYYYYYYYSVKVQELAL